jgi:protein phosphatase
MLISATMCHPGLAREQNEDSYVSNEQAQLWLVADGVGGHQGGQVASQLAVQTVDRRYRQGTSLQDAVMAANLAIREIASQQNELVGMASTLVGVCFKGVEYELVWLGDSRAYLIDAGLIQQLSTDHNVANDLYQKGEIQAEEVFDHPGQHELTQALGQCSLQSVPHFEGRLQPGQCLLLCTDGLSGVLTEQEIGYIVSPIFSEHASLKQVADALLQRVLAEGAPDNVCFTLIQRQQAIQQHTQAREALSVLDSACDTAVSAGKIKTVNLLPFTWMILAVVVAIMCLILFIG